MTGRQLARRALALAVLTGACAATAWQVVDPFYAPDPPAYSVTCRVIEPNPYPVCTRP